MKTGRKKMNGKRWKAKITLYAAQRRRANVKDLVAENQCSFVSKAELIIERRHWFISS